MRAQRRLGRVRVAVADGVEDVAVAQEVDAVALGARGIPPRARQPAVKACVDAGRIGLRGIRRDGVEGHVGGVERSASESAASLASSAREGRDVGLQRMERRVAHEGGLQEMRVS
jgi:hypothetical protein